MNASLRTPKQVCSHCGRAYKPTRPKWQRYCKDKCRLEAFKARERDKIIADYLAQEKRKA